MRTPAINDPVRLLHDVPNLYLQKGDVGVVRAMWFEPTTAYEVEFHPPGLGQETRTILPAEDIQVTGDERAVGD